VSLVGRVLGNQFSTSVTVDYTPFTNLAATPDALIEYVNQLFMGGRMSSTERTRILTAVQASPSTDALGRAKTAVYVTLVAAQAQVDN
jgi:hypothetical protein